MVQFFGKTAWQCHVKLSIHLPFNLAIPFLCIYPRKMETYEHTRTYTGMFIVALFIITKKPETISMAIGNKQMIKYPCNGILVGSKKEKTVYIHNLDES